LFKGRAAILADSQNGNIIVLSESISNNRKEQGFLLVEIRIAIQGVDSH
jgi:hypothetical protein